MLHTYFYNYFVYQVESAYGLWLVCVRHLESTWFIIVTQFVYEMGG